MIKAVIFDMDGTLIDTEKYYRIAWKYALESFGYHPTEEQLLMFRSLGRPFSSAYLKKTFGEELEYEQVRKVRQGRFNELVETQGIQLKLGAKEILTFLREKHIVTAIATCTNIERANQYLKQIGLYDLLDRVISASMVETGKPAPDIYLYACKELGLNPANCMAVEDSPNGIHSAHDAGCNVVMVPDQSPADDEIRKVLYGYENSLFDLKKYFASF